jgi:benzoyl-CoA reductase subunit C
MQKPQRGAAFQTLAHHYDHRQEAARAAHAAGRKVIGRIGHTVPVELILAAGAMPVLITANLDRKTPVADIYVDPELPPETRTLFEAGVDGDFEFLDLLVLSRPYDKLYYFLKEIYRLGRAPKMPPFAIYDLMQSQRDAVRAYNEDRLQDLMKRIARVAGRIDEASLTAAIAATNRTRALQRQLGDLRTAGMIGGVEAMQAIGAGFFMDPKTYADSLSAFIAEAGAAPALASRHNVLLITAEPLGHTNVHQLLEAAGANVIAEDDTWGARAAGDDISASGNPLRAILDKYWSDVPTSGVWPPSARETWMMQQASRSDVDAIVLYIPPSDRLLGWDAPRLAEAFRQKGKPVHLTFHDALRDKGRAAIASELETFFAGITGRMETAR